MEIGITQWALDSYLDLKHRHVFDQTEFEGTVKPDVKRLRDYPNDPKFNNGKFWSVASDASGKTIPGGYKMKWHQVGNGRVQLRLPITLQNKAYLCQGYVKSNDKVDRRMLAKFKAHSEMIRKGQHQLCGVLS